MDRILPVAILVVLGAVWGITVPLSKIAVSTGYQPFGIVLWQIIFSGLFLTIFMLFRRVKVKLRAEHLVLFTVVILVGTIIPGAFSYVAAVHLPAGVVAISISSVAMFSLPIAVLLRVDRFSTRRVLGLCFGLCGIIALIGPSTSLPDPSKSIYILVSLVAVFSYAVEGNFVAKYGLRGLDPVQTLVGASVVGVVIVTPITLATGQWVDLSIPWGAPEWAIFTQSIFHAIAYTGYVWLVGRTGSVFAAQVGYMVTGFGVIWSIFLLGEEYSGWIWAALVLMLVGLALVLPRRPDSQVALEADPKIGQT